MTWAEREPSKMETLMIKHDSQRWSDSDIDRLSGYTIFKIQLSRVSIKSDTFFNLKIVCPLPEFGYWSQDLNILHFFFILEWFCEQNWLNQDQELVTKKLTKSAKILHSMQLWTESLKVLREGIHGEEKFYWKVAQLFILVSTEEKGLLCMCKILLLHMEHVFTWH